MDRPRLVEVAARAGVSRTAASAALGGYGRVAESTRQHVLEVAREMGYEPNRLARNLRTRTAGAVALYLPAETTGHGYYMEFAFGVVEEAKLRQISVLLLPSGDSPGALARDHVDGYIFVDALDDDNFVARILAQDKPVVSAESPPPGAVAPAATVSVNHVESTRRLLDHIEAQGAHRPAMIAPPLTSSWARKVHDAYYSWCSQRAMTPNLAVAPFVPDPRSIEEAVETVMGGATQPDAVVSAHDESAPMVGFALAARGFVIGQDILLAACVDGVTVRHHQPPITAMDIRPREHGATCARILLDVIAGTAPAPIGIIEHPTTLRQRASTSGGLEGRASAPNAANVEQYNCGA